MRHAARRAAHRLPSLFPLSLSLSLSLSRARVSRALTPFITPLALPPPLARRAECVLRLAAPTAATQRGCGKRDTLLITLQSPVRG